ncbi:MULTISPECIES: chalcone isomerase family protein [Burkholderiales]|uniref:chalcone isomerase family protein n=1 Tax=Burkholderiales TaxID=80840 RepID=UPI002719DA63|nr:MULTISPECIES: chalcone isomerase family protein [Burkholderiales]MDO9144822.1 chalcone isomerase family protein [Rhodoferax sp.]MDP3272417.1 chalcone isomerase family protein [Limnobacter sp.]MDP3337324.1 chalcone isomerase family protein [Rhodoferax sp.]MDP3886962.1 chalcone isomerase family protein [Hydrogenophaga sp.]
MKPLVRQAVLTGAAGLFSLQVWATSLPVELRLAMPAAALAGQAKLTFWGFEVYQASLWVAPGFTAKAYADHGFALELSYLRDFAGADIAKRSLAEMARQVPINAHQATRWGAQMHALFPDVKAGERLTGIHLPGVGARFVFNGQPLGDIADAEFARLFFGIWLSPQTSEPKLRLALLQQLAPAAGATP